MRVARAIGCVLVLVAGCSREPGSLVPGVTQSESALKAYVAWQHDWKALALRQRAERDAKTQELRGQVPPGGNGMAQDSTLRELIARQDADMTRFTETTPKGPMATALRSALAGIGSITGDARGMRYTPRHDEAQLDRARAQYGAPWVAWVLKHEATINATLGSDQ